VRDRPLAEIWQASPAFQAFRGTDWMPEPCRSCPLKEQDYGGCRCQAMALTGDPRNTDPACELSPHHARIFSLAEAESAAEPPPFVYRRIGAATQQVGAAAASAC
jgi:pyrroloquinoline quinone biosynthesis protein E